MKRGDIVSAKIIEVLSDQSLILSFNGKLLRVVNQTSQSYQMNEMVLLKVDQTYPLRFQLYLDHKVERQV